MSYMVTRLNALNGAGLAWGSRVSPTRAVRWTSPQRRRATGWVFFSVRSCVLALVGAAALGAQTKPLYENNFEKTEAGKVPEDFLVYEGAWAVREEGGNRFLELPGAPVDTFAVLFGPT